MKFYFYDSFIQIIICLYFFNSLYRYLSNYEYYCLQVPVGTIIKNSDSKMVGDLKEEGAMFILARGGAGGHGNHFFISSTNQSPSVAECGADGESITYILELRSMANFGLVSK